MFDVVNENKIDLFSDGVKEESVFVLRFFVGLFIDEVDSKKVWIVVVVVKVKVKKVM